MKVFVDHKTALTLGDKDEVAAKISGSTEINEAYNEYETTCTQIRQENATLLDGFVLMLRSQRLAPSTIRKHKDNVDFFINEYLLYTDPAQRAPDGISEVNEFYGDWFIRKAMWSTPGSIKSSATSLYKFYAFLAASGKVTVTDLAELKRIISRRLPEWQARCARYNDADIDDWR